MGGRVVIGAHKLTQEMVLEIKELFLTTKYSDGKIGKMYGVSREHINKIRNGRRWNEDTRSFIMKDVVSNVLFDVETQRPVIKKKTIFKRVCRSIGYFFLSLS